ncbi:MAG: N-acetylmuramoyl-L-alanine amidase [Bacteroidia bacterium]
MSLRCVILLTSILFSCLNANAQGTWLASKAKRGDGAISLLRKYRIYTPCNLRKFYQLNKLKKNQGLKVGNDYLMPVAIRKYNGTSIRSTLKISDWDQAVRIQKYNEFVHVKLALKPSDYRTDKELWVPHNMLNCLAELEDLSEPDSTVRVHSATTSAEPEDEAALPATGAMRGVYEIFGKKYQEVPLVSKKLEGCVYYIVAGHGGPDPGAVGTRGGNDLCEDEYAYDVSLRLARKLLSHGATAYIIIRDTSDGIRDDNYLPCDKDEICWGDVKIPRHQKTRLHQRSDVVNALFLKNRRQGVNYQRMVVVHVDSEAKKERVDMFFYHRLGDPTAKAFASTLQTTIKEKYDEVQKNRGYEGFVSVRDLHMLRETLPPTAFVELGNIRNYADQQRLVVPRNRELVADWLFAGMLRDFSKYQKK